MTPSTPGPWEYDDTFQYYGDRVVRHNGVVIASLPPLPPPVGMSDREHAANARLIAAAPEMLEALQAFLNSTFYGDIPPEKRDHARPIFEHARALLARIEGKA